MSSMSWRPPHTCATVRPVLPSSCRHRHEADVETLRRAVANLQVQRGESVGKVAQITHPWAEAYESLQERMRRELAAREAELVAQAGERERWFVEAASLREKAASRGH